jgi:hypothetical protein
MAKDNVNHFSVRQIINCPLCDLSEVSKRPSGFMACSQEAPVKLLNRCCDATHWEPGSVAPKSCHIEPSKFKTNVRKITDKRVHSDVGLYLQINTEKRDVVSQLVVGSHVWFL